MWWRVASVLLGLGSLAAFVGAFYIVVLEKEAHEAKLDKVRAEREQSAIDSAPSEPKADETPRGQPSPTMAWKVEPPLRLGLPVECTPGQDCWVVNYVDIDPGPGRSDFMCLDMSYDGHKGTDFALANIAELNKSIPVMAAAAGRVVGTRNEMRDISIRNGGRDDVKDRECGNGVRIDHGEGWATQYCHMKQGSVVVSAGQQVAQGQVLGAVGLSGMTEFPHLHLSVSKDGEVVDPFRGVDGAPDCGPGAAPLWNADLANALAYRAPKLLDLGLASRPIERTEAERGLPTPDQMSADGEALILWMRIAGVRRGDHAEISISGPGGRAFETDWVAEKTQIVRFQYFGRRTPDGGWQAGRYSGRVVLSRGGAVTADRTIEVAIQ